MLGANNQPHSLDDAAKIARLRAHVDELAREWGGTTYAIKIMRQQIDRMAGDNLPKARRKKEKKFWAKIEQRDNGCWIWTPYQPGISPTVHWHSKLWSPRRVVWELTRLEPYVRPEDGTIPVFEPTCDAFFTHEHCVNLAHMYRLGEKRQKLGPRGRPLGGKARPPSIPAPALYPDLEFFCTRGHTIPRVDSKCRVCEAAGKSEAMSTKILTSRISKLLEEA